MAILNYPRGFFPFPVVTARLWNGTDFYQCPAFDGGIVRLGNGYFPGKTGAALTASPTGLGILYPDGTPKSAYIPVVGPGTAFPVGMSLDSACKLYWRIKTINLDVTALFQGGTPGTNSAMIDRSGLGAQGEVDLAAQIGWLADVYDNVNINAMFSAYDQNFFSTNLFDSNGLGYNGYPNGGPLGSPCEIDGDVLSGFPLICFCEATGLYYPLILIGSSSQPGSLIGCGASSCSVKVGSITGSVETLYGPSLGTMTFVEGSLSFEVIGNYTNPQDVSAGYYQQTIDVSPQDWWPYDPGDGLGPFYDTTSGAKIR